MSAAAQACAERGGLGSAWCFCSMSLRCFGDPGSACYWDEKSRGCTNISDYRREPSLHFHLDFEPSFFGPWARPTPLPRGWEPQSSLTGCHSAMRKHAANLPASTVFLKCTRAPASCLPLGGVFGVAYSAAMPSPPPPPAPSSRAQFDHRGPEHQMHGGGQHGRMERSV